MTQTVDVAQILSMTVVMFNALWPALSLMVTIGVAAGLAQKIARYIKGVEEPFLSGKQKRKLKEPILEDSDLNYSELEPLPKRKNGELLRIGDDGELIFDGFEDRNEG